MLVAAKLNRLEYTTLQDQVLALLHRLNASPGIKDRSMPQLARNSILFVGLPEPKRPLGVSQAVQNGAHGWQEVVEESRGEMVVRDAYGMVKY